MTMEIFFDGGTKGNRICIVKNNKKVYGRAKIRVLNTPQTNNQLEYSALLMALRSFNSEAIVHIMGDSKLVINQMKGKYQIKSKKLIDLHEQVVEEIRLRDLKILFYWVPREENLAGIELDKK